MAASWHDTHNVARFVSVLLLFYFSFLSRRIQLNFVSACKTGSLYCEEAFSSSTCVQVYANVSSILFENSL